MSSVDTPNGIGEAPAHEAPAEVEAPAVSASGGASASPPAANGNGSASPASAAAVSPPAAPVTLPPPGYVLVTLQLEGQERPALLHLPVEVRGKEGGACGSAPQLAGGAWEVQRRPPAPCVHPHSRTCLC
jgi:hypothetical protein